MDNSLKLIEAQKKLCKIDQLFRLLKIPFDASAGDFDNFDSFIDANDSALFEIGKNIKWVTPEENKNHI